MSLPPLPTPFPPGRWQVRWVAGIQRHNEASRTSSRLLLVIAPIRSELGNTVSGTRLWTNDAVDLSRQRTFAVPLTYMAATPVGTIGTGDRLIATRGTTFDLDLDVPELEHHIQIDDRRPQKDGFMVDSRTHSFGPQFRQLKNTSCLVLPDRTGRQIIIPTFELIRFYWATSSSTFAERLFNHPTAQLLKPEGLTAFVNPAYTGLDDQGVFSCALRPGLSASDTYALGRLWLDVKARQCVTNLLVGFRLSQPKMLGLATSTGFPFVGRTQLRVEGIETIYPDNSSTLLVYRIRQCSHPFPFLCPRPIMSYGKVTRTPPEPNHPGSGAGPDGTLILGGSSGKKGKRPLITAWPPPRQKRPIMYTSTPIKDLFLDAAKKPPIVMTETVEGKIIHPPATEDQPPVGGFGPGVSGGEGTPVGTSPGEEARDEPPAGDPASPPSPPLKHLETLAAAAKILEARGYAVEPQCVTHPEEGLFAFVVPDGMQGKGLWVEIYDARLGQQRPRQGKLLQIGKVKRKSLTEKPELLCGYAFDLETEGGAFLYFQHTQQRPLSPAILQSVIESCSSHEGVWRRRRPGNADGKKKSGFQTHLKLDDVKVDVTSHWWRDDADKLAGHIAGLHEGSWEGLPSAAGSSPATHQ